MWPFKPKACIGFECPDSIKEMHKERINDFKEFRAIGERFTYLGVTMVVTGHQELCQYLGIGELIYRAKLSCDYIDHEGRITNGWFDYGHYPVLLAENIENGKTESGKDKKDGNDLSPSDPFLRFDTLADALSDPD